MYLNLRAPSAPDIQTKTVSSHFFDIFARFSFSSCSLDYFSVFLCIYKKNIYFIDAFSKIILTASKLFNK